MDTVKRDRRKSPRGEMALATCLFGDGEIHPGNKSAQVAFAAVEGSPGKWFNLLLTGKCRIEENGTYEISLEASARVRPGVSETAVVFRLELERGDQSFTLAASGPASNQGDVLQYLLAYRGRLQKGDLLTLRVNNNAETWLKPQRGSKLVFRRA